MSTYDGVKAYLALKERLKGQSDERQKAIDKKIDAEYKYRHKKNCIADDPKDYAKGRPLGEQDIGDLSYKDPWQYVFREETGISMPVNTPYKCPVCGFTHMLELPPERCFNCGCYSFLHDTKVLKLKR
jgi:hypothetical protein